MVYVDPVKRILPDRQAASSVGGLSVLYCWLGVERSRTEGQPCPVMQ